LRRKADRKLTGTKQFEDVKKGVHCTTSKDASKKLGEPRPTTETADYLVTLAGDADMNKAMDTASWNMIELLQKQKGLITSMPTRSPVSRWIVGSAKWRRSRIACTA
jgi:hypothetical protein